MITELYKNPLPSSRTGPLYNAFSYPTKISPETVAVFIASHTQPGATIADTFAGSGSTGLAALLCDAPTQGMLNQCRELGIQPVWGPRTAHLFEIGVLGSFVAKVMCSKVDPDGFDGAANALIARASARLNEVYESADDSGNPGSLRHAIWSDVLRCPHCRFEVTYWDAAVGRAPLCLKDSFVCRECGRTTKISRCDRVFDNVYDPLLKKQIEKKKRVMVYLYGQSGNRKWQRVATAEDNAQARAVEAMELPRGAPIAELQWGDLYRSGYHRGITHLHHFYTHRNFLAIATLWDEIEFAPAEFQESLKLLVLSYNATHSTLMTRVVVKNGQTDFVLTGAQSGVLYISGLPVEKNVLFGVARKIGGLRAVFSLLKGSRSRVRVHNHTSEQIPLESGTVDYVFTDPPFGDYIPYAEINQLNEFWLSRTTDRKHEIIVSSTQKKGVEEYGTMLGNVFVEMARVLKADGKATIVFHSAQSEIWKAFTEAFGRAGMRIIATSILDKLQASFKQVVSNVSVKGDPLLLLEKGRQAAAVGPTPSLLALEMIETASISNLRTPVIQKLYSQYVTHCLANGNGAPIGAREFHEMANCPQ